MKNKLFLLTCVLVLALLSVAGCQGETVEVTRVVQETIVETVIEKETVMVEGTPQVKEVEVTKEVVKEVEVEKEVVVTATPLPKSGELTVIIRSEPDSLDPNYHSSRFGAAIMRNVFDPLVAVDSDGSLQPALAESWEVAGDNTSITFHLREGVKFHDGTPFNAEALKFNFDRIVDPATESRGAINFLGPYDHSEVIDEHTLKVHFTEPYPFLNFVSIQNGTYFAPNSPAAVEEWGEDYGQHPVGTGPYIFKEWVLGESFTIEKNPEYDWAPAIYDHAQPYVDKMTFKIVKEPGTRAAVLQTGEANVVLDLPTEWVTRISTDENFNVLMGDLSGPGLMYVVSTVWPGLDDITVRKALQYAVNRDNVMDTVYMGIYTAQYGPLSEKTPCFDKEAASMYSYDPEKAKELLAEAGWTDSDGDGIVDKDGEPLKITIWTLVDPRLGEVFQAQMREVGVDAELFFHTGGPLRMEKARAGDFGLMWLRWTSTDPGILRVLWHSNQIGAWNFALLEDPEIDEALDKGASVGTMEERCEYYTAAQRKLMENAVVIPVNTTPQIIGTSADVKGLVMDRSGDWAPDFYDVYVEQ